MWIRFEGLKYAPYYALSGLGRTLAILPGATRSLRFALAPGFEYSAPSAPQTSK